MLLPIFLLSISAAQAGKITLFCGPGCTGVQSKFVSSYTIDGCYQGSGIAAVEIGRDNYNPCVFSLYSDTNCQKLSHTPDTSKGYTGNCLNALPNGGYQSTRVTCNPSKPYPSKADGAKARSQATTWSADAAGAEPIRLVLPEENSTTTTTHLEKPDRPIEDLRDNLLYFGTQLSIAGYVVGGKNIVVQAVKSATGGFPLPGGAIYADARTFISQFWSGCLFSRSATYEDIIQGASGVLYSLNIEGVEGYIPHNYV